MTIRIRPYRETDRETLRTLTVESFQGVSIDHNIDRVLGTVAGRDWRWRKARHVDLDIDGPGCALAVAEDETGATVGYVTMQFDRETLIGWIHNLAVDSGIRNRGLGRLLLEHALDRFRAEGMTVAKIETLEQNPVGRHLYPSLGFREVARQIHYALDLRAGPEAEDVESDQT
jgi:ribosomal protein S18 acetylase RimI-like enzyme